MFCRTKLPDQGRRNETYQKAENRKNYEQFDKGKAALFSPQSRYDCAGDASVPGGYPFGKYGNHWAHQECLCELVKIAYRGSRADQIANSLNNRRVLMLNFRIMASECSRAEAIANIPAISSFFRT